jgi:tetratricopeptide (TPR) repeat protein
MLFALIALYSLRTVTRNADWNDEITIGKKTLEVSSKSGWALTTLGQNYLEGDNYEEAIKYLEKAVKQAPGYDLAHNLLGTAYFKTGHYAAAASEFIKSLRLNYEASPPVHDMLGISYASLKMYNKARKEFETAQRIDPDFINPYLNMGRLYEIKNNYPAALKQYFRAVVHAKNNAYLLSVTYIRIGDAYARMGLADKAKRYYINARNSLRPDMEGLLKLVSEKINSLPK